MVETRSLVIPSTPSCSTRRSTFGVETPLDVGIEHHGDDRLLRPPRTSPTSSSESRKRSPTLRSDLPDTLKLNEAELSAEQRRLANFVDFIGEGRGSQALAKAPVETERRVDALTDDVDTLRSPPREDSSARRRSNGSGSA
jgi:hypothetical protein